MDIFILKRKECAVLAKIWKRLFFVSSADAAVCPLQFDRRSRRRLMWSGKLGRSN